jgi:hypothetical protein
MAAFSRKGMLSLTLLVGASLIGFGCVGAPAAYRKNPQFDSFCKDIKTYGLVKPRVEVFEISAGGVPELRDDWCAAARGNVVAALERKFSSKMINLKTIEPDVSTSQEFDEVSALYKVVSYSIKFHTYAPAYIFPEKVDKFDYSLGPIDRLLERYGCDGLIFVYGHDEISTAGRKTLMAAGIVVGALTGVYAGPRGGATTIDVALVDASGTILWYSFQAQGASDLRDPGSAAQLVDRVMSNFPECQK